MRVAVCFVLRCVVALLSEASLHKEDTMVGSCTDDPTGKGHISSWCIHIGEVGPYTPLCCRRASW